MRARVFVSGTGFSLLRFGWVTVRVTAVVTHLVLYTYKHNQLMMSCFPGAVREIESQAHAQAQIYI